MTVTVHVLHAQTQQGPSVVHVTILILEMEELAMFYQQVIIVYSRTVTRKPLD